MKTLRQIQTEAVRLHRTKHGCGQLSTGVIMEIRTDINSLQLNPNSKTDAISALLNILRLLDVQGVSGDAALIMGEQLIKLEESKLEHGK